MKKVYLVLLLLGLVLVPMEGLAQRTNDCRLAELAARCSSFSYQQGFSGNAPVFRSTFDTNVNLAFLNFGYSYNSEFKSNFYVGVGIFSFIQLQHGYALKNNKHIFKIRSDFPLSILKYKINIPPNKEPWWSHFTCGLYFENTFNDEKRGSEFGLILGYSFMGILEKSNDILDNTRGY